MSSSWAGDNTSTAPLSHATTHDHYHPVKTPLQGDPNFNSHLPSQGATALGYGGPSDWEYFAPEPHAVSPEITYSIPADSKPPQDSEARPENVIDQPPERKPSPDQAEQRPQSQGALSSSQESLSPDEPQPSPLHRTGTIDGVIHAWNAPLQPRKDFLRNSSVSGSSSLPSTNSILVHAQNQIHLQELRAQTPTPQNFVVASSDPYSDLDAQYRASLARFVTMLRKEQATESDEEKYKIFDSFVRKETKLRAVLYDIDLTPSKPELRTQEITRDKEISQTVIETAVQASQQQVDAHKTSENAPRSPSPAAVQQEQVQEGRTTPSQAATSKVDESPRSKDDSFVMVDRDQDSEAPAYSPGGRPLISRPITVNTQVAQIARSKPATPPPEDRSGPSPSDNAPQVVAEDYANTGPLSPDLSAPIVLAPREPESSPQLRMMATSNGPLPMLLKFEPSRPVYTPFRYAEGSQSQDHLDVERPADQDYLSKRNTYDSSRLMAGEASPNVPNINRVSSPSAVKKAQEETFLGLLRSHSTVRPKDKSMSIPDSIRPGTTPPFTQIRPDPVRDALQALRSSLPLTVPDMSRNGRAGHLRQQVEAFVDDFSFIRDTMILWDRDNREVRKKLDEERHRRQEESESRLDELFNDNEIAYAELKGMETDFKLAEAERRYEEDKQELESFTQGVYNVVTTKLQQQVDELSKEYSLAVDLLDLDSDPASRLLKDASPGRSSMSEAMDIVLQLFEKLNVRYHKLAEARFERERRRKRLELTVLFTNGDSEGTKKLEKEFSTAEKLQVVYEARDKDQRASKLMDTFERATVRALGDNQGYLEDLFEKISGLNNVLCADGAWQQNATDTVYGENGARTALTSARAVVGFVLEDSRALLNRSNVVDKILNDADYAVSVAEARVAGTNDTIYKKLKADKEKEDGKLLEEVRMRMDSITKTPSDATNLIQEIVDRIGADKEHPERMKRALEAAKMRNAGNKLE
jgi:hypothetical protein